MGFRKDAYATVWEIENKGKYHKGKISTSKKNKETDKYETDFSGFITLVGKAHEQAVKNDLQPKSRIKIGDCEVTRKYVKETDKEYINFTIFSFELPDDNGEENKKETPAKQEKLDLSEFEEKEDDGDLPF